MKTAAIDTQAAEWHVRSEGGLSASEQIELESWLAANAAHRAAYERTQASSRALDRLAVFRPRDGQIEADLPLPRSRLPRRKRFSPARLAMTFAAAAAAALAVGYVGWWRPQFGAAAETVVTARGGFQRIELPDGSLVSVNTDSQVEIDYTRDRRAVRLMRGEAHFEVAKNSDRPFIVSAEGYAVRAVGTAFNVRLRDAAVEVIVTEGIVSVADAEQGAERETRYAERQQTTQQIAGSPSAPRVQPVELAAGQSLQISKNAAPTTESARPVTAAQPVIAPVAETEITQRLSWREQRLVFDPTPLKDVIAEFNRYNERQLKVGDEATGQILVGGTFKANDADTFVELLESSFNIKAARAQNSTVLVHVP